MLTQIKRSCCALLLALPVAAMADTVTVTAHATGTTFVVDREVVEALGMTYTPGPVPYDPVYLPYELTLTTTFDTDTANVRDDYAGGNSNPSVIDFRLGDQTYHFAGQAAGTANLDTSGSNDVFTSRVAGSFYGPYGPYSLSFQLRGEGPDGSLGAGDVLATRNVGDGAGLAGGLNIVWSLNEGPYIPSYIFDDSSNPATFSLQVSPVPEPATYAMLGGGLLFLGWRRRVRG